MSQLYIQLTDRCNMRCAHCCFDCTAKGSDLDFDSFKRIVQDYLRDNGEAYITLGGGEPTLWKHFPEMVLWLREMLPIWNGGKYQDIHFFMVTNGTRKLNSFRAIRLMEEVMEQYDGRDWFNVVMSGYDGYHEPEKVNPEVREYFYSRRDRERQRKNNAPYGTYHEQEFVRVVETVVPVGRAAQLSPSVHRRRYSPTVCCCEGLFITPDGNIHPCGCKQSPVIGNAWRLPTYEEEMEAFEKFHGWRNE